MSFQCKTGYLDIDDFLDINYVWLSDSIVQ